MTNPDAPNRPAGGAAEHAHNGVYLPDFGNFPHDQFSNGMHGPGTGMLHELRTAGQYTFAGLPPGERRGEHDPRHVPLRVGRYGGPRGTFLVDRALAAAVDLAGGAWGDLSHNEMAGLGIANTESTVRPDFTPDAINALNQTYYQSSVAYAPEAGLADVFGRGVMLNLLLGAYLAEQRGGAPLKVREYGSGRLTDRWEIIARAAQERGASRLQAIITDFSPPPLPVPEPGSILQAKAEQYSLHDDLPHLPDFQREDVHLMTYVADSVWMADDARITRLDGKWYRSLYRLKVDEWSPRREVLLQALRTGTGLPSSGNIVQDARALEGIFVEEVMEETSRDQVPYADFLQARREGISINVPGGLIKRICQAFERQLKPDGMFISMDVADIEPPDAAPLPANVSGLAARFKIEDYALARHILETEGYQVEFVRLSDLAERILEPGWEHSAFPDEREGIQKDLLQVMVVRRPQQ